jgi:hypothetical protein
VSGFLLYVAAQIDEYNKTHSWRIYMSDAVRSCGKKLGEYPKTRWADLINPVPEVDAVEVINNVIRNAQIGVTA